MSWNKLFSDAGIYMDSETRKIKYDNGEVVEYIAPPATELATRRETITETIYDMLDVYHLLGKLMDNTIQLTNIEVEHFSFNSQPCINVEYRRTQPCSIGLPPSTGYVDACSHDDAIENLKKEIDRQLIEELEREKIKEEPKEETVLQFKEISW